MKHERETFESDDQYEYYIRLIKRIHEEAMMIRTKMESVQQSRSDLKAVEVIALSKYIRQMNREEVIELMEDLYSLGYSKGYTAGKRLSAKL